MCHLLADLWDFIEGTETATPQEQVDYRRSHRGRCRQLSWLSIPHSCISSYRAKVLRGPGKHNEITLNVIS